MPSNGIAKPTSSAPRRSPRSRGAADTLNRLERGEDVTVKSMFDILRAMGLCIRLEPAGIPTLAEMRERFGGDDDGDE